MARRLFGREEKRDSPLYVYLRKSERAVLDAMAEEFGQSVSTMSREIILDYAKLYQESKNEIVEGGS